MPEKKFETNIKNQPVRLEPEFMPAGFIGMVQNYRNTYHQLTGNKIRLDKAIVNLAMDGMRFNELNKFPEEPFENRETKPLDSEVKK